VIPELPLTLVQSLERRLVTSTAAATSPFTGTAQVQDWGGEWWEYSFEMALMKGRNGRRLSAFFAALGGMRGRFLFRDPSVDQADLVGNPAVSGAGQTGNALVTLGWAPSVAALQAGDLFQLGLDATTRLYQVTQDAVADASGQANLQFTPKLRASPAEGAAVEIVNPAVLLRLTSPVPTRIGRADSFRFTLNAREAL